MNPLKALGHDGMSPIFYQHFRGIVGKDVIVFVSHFFSTCEVLKNLNKTNLALILKCVLPLNLNHFRSISMCNVVYKIILKNLANRIKPVLPNLISPLPTPFVGVVYC